MRQRLSFHVEDTFADKLCLWLESQDLAMCFRGNGWQLKGELLAGFGVHHRFEGGHIDKLSDFHQSINDIVFCHFNYDVKNQLEHLSSDNADRIDFPLFSLFVPKIVIELKEENVEFLFYSEETTVQYVEQCFHSIVNSNLVYSPSGNSQVNQRISKPQYSSDLAVLRTHLQRGDVYQANYCQEFYWKEVNASIARLFNEGFAAMKNPFSVYYKNGHHAVASFSPERFLKFDNRSVTSQPMKGTAPRSSDPIADKANKEALRTSEKERRENVMIVDLVRNDLSHYATKASVKVPELYRIASYARVHQMYSTVTAELKPEATILDALLKAFPMGSMTGAPKVRAMQILEELEHSKRGIYSGTIGFISPDGIADFNVVIRSLVYNADQHYLSCHVGGGITDLSLPEAEYEECMVKVSPLIELVEKHFPQSPSTILPLKDEKTAS